MDKVKEAFIDLVLAILKGAKILIVYVLPSALVALLLSSELREYLTTRPELIGLVPAINVVLVAVADIIKRKLPEDSNVKKML